MPFPLIIDSLFSIDEIKFLEIGLYINQHRKKFDNVWRSKIVIEDWILRSSHERKNAFSLEYKYIQGKKQ